VCGVVGAGAVVGYVTMSTPAPAPAIAAATGPRGPAEPPPEVDDGTWTEADMKHCRSVAERAGDAAAARMLTAVGANRVGLGGPSETMIEQAAHLLCEATRKRLHLCQGYWRKQLIAAVKDYAAEFRKVSSEIYWTNYNVAERAKRNSANDQADWQSVTDDLRQTTGEMARMHEEILGAFRVLIADGIVDPDDFGVFLGLGIPSDIEKMIGDARRVRRLCR